MRNKKVFAVVLACVLALALAACSGGSGSGKSNADAPDPEKIQGEKVTEKEWKKAFDFSDVTNMTFAISSATTREDGDVCKEIWLYCYQETKLYWKEDEAIWDKNGKRVETLADGEEYISYEDGMVYEYVYRDSRWQKRHTEENNWPTVRDLLQEDTDGALEELYELYDMFAYDAKQKAHTGTIEGTDVTVKIVKGKLQLVIFETEDYTASIQCYNYGITKVTLPKAVGEESGSNLDKVVIGEKVTETQWRAACDLVAIGNFTVNITGKGVKKSCSGVMKWAEDKAYSKWDAADEGDGWQEEEYWSRENGTMYYYTYDAQRKSWKKDTWTGFGTHRNWTPEDILGIYDISDWYKGFEYDGQKYISHMNDWTYNIKIANGKLYEMQGEDDDMLMTWRFSDYGSTKVTLPKVSEGEEETVRNPRATFELSDGCKLEMMIWEDKCPIAATNFIFLAQIGFFDGTIIYDAKEDYHYMRFGDRTGYGTNDTRYRDENFLNGISKDIFNLEVLTQYKTQSAANKLGYKLRKDDGGDKNRFGEQFVLSYYSYNTADFVINLQAGNTSFRLNPPGTTGTSTMDDYLVAFGAFEDKASQEVLQDILYNTEKNFHTGINNTIGLADQIRIERVKLSNLDSKKWENFEFISYMNTAYNGSAAWRNWSASV